MENLEKKAGESKYANVKTVLTVLGLAATVIAVVYGDSGKKEGKNYLPPARIILDEANKEDLMISDGKVYTRAPEGGWTFLKYKFN